METLANRVKSIVLNNLHGLYSYNIEIPEKQPVFVITGPNGYGKTTILAILYHLYRGDLWLFYYLVFGSITISFSDEHSFVFTKVLATDSNSMMDSGALDSSYVQVDFFDGTKLVESFKIDAEYVDGLVKQYRSSFPWEHKYREPEQLIRDEYNLQNDIYLQNVGRYSLLFISSLKSTYVSARRLVDKSTYNFLDDESDLNTIEEISSVIVSDYKKAQTEFAEISQQTDATFINRLLDAQSRGVHEDVVLLNHSVETIKSRIEQYRKYQLVPEIQFLDKVPESNGSGPVLSLYLSDMETKMNALAPFYERLNAFSSFVSRCVLSDKEMVLGPQGIRIFNVNGDQIRLDLLSDGEQDLIILAFFLTYSATPSDLLLIDQPEDSLHMSWLESLLDGFIGAASSVKNQIITATHSPAFIGGKWQLTYDLFENNLNK